MTASTVWVLGQHITCLILAKWPFSTSLGRYILLFFFFNLIFHFYFILKALLPVRLQLSYTLWIAGEFHIESMGWFSSLLHRQDVPRLLTKAAWITHQGEELVWAPPSPTDLWESPTRAAQDSGALEISNCRLVSSCIGICFKHWLAPYYVNNNPAKGPLLPQGEGKTSTLPGSQGGYWSPVNRNSSKMNN